MRNVSPIGLLCFLCRIFSLSGPCELLFLWVEVFCWIYYVWSSKECVCVCAHDPIVHLVVHSLGVVCVCVCRELSPHLEV